MTGQYLVPTAVEEALGFLSAGAVSVVAGGTDFYPSRSLPPRGDILDITRIEGLRGITRQPDGAVRIGAATRWSEVVRAELPPAFLALQQAAREVGSVQIQNAGTVGGNLCNASPAADGVPPLLILDAEVEIAGETGLRRLALEDFVTGVRQTALQPGELLTALHIPPLPEGSASAFEKLGARRYLVISIAMTAALVATDADGRIRAVRIAIGSCSAVARRLRALEAHLIGQSPAALSFEAAHLSALAPISDVRADAAYRLEAAAEQICRAVQRGAAAHG